MRLWLLSEAGFWADGVCEAALRPTGSGCDCSPAANACDVLALSVLHQSGADGDGCFDTLAWPALACYMQAKRDGIDAGLCWQHPGTAMRVHEPV